MKCKILSLVVFITAVIPAIVFAQTPAVPGFRPLVGIPGITDPNNLHMGVYINALYTLSISIAALLAVIKIIIAGVKYMLSDVVTSKEEAKKDIKGALLGLLIVISAVIILETINPQLRTLNIFMVNANQVDGVAIRPNTRPAAQPLPSLVRSENTVTTACATEQECDNERNRCLNSASNAWIEPASTNTGQITCTYDITHIQNCNPRAGLRNPCLSAQQWCTRNRGTFTQESDMTIRCVVPHLNRPGTQAD